MDESTPEWSGESLRQLATDGRLVLSGEDVEQALASIEQTLATVHGYLDDLHHARTVGPSGFTADELGQEVIDLCVAEMVQPGQLAHSLDELAKYAEAFRLIATMSTDSP